MTTPVHSDEFVLPELRSADSRWGRTLAIIAFVATTIPAVSLGIAMVGDLMVVGEGMWDMPWLLGMFSLVLVPILCPLAIVASVFALRALKRAGERLTLAIWALSVSVAVPLVFGAYLALSFWMSSR